MIATVLYSTWASPLRGMTNVCRHIDPELQRAAAEAMDTAFAGLEGKAAEKQRRRYSLRRRRALPAQRQGVVVTGAGPVDMGPGARGEGSWKINAPLLSM